MRLSFDASDESDYFAAIAQRFRAGTRGVRCPDAIPFMYIWVGEHNTAAQQTRDYGLHVCVLPAHGCKPVLHDQTLLVQGGKITAIGSFVSGLTDAWVIDGHGNACLSPGSATCRSTPIQSRI